jgi:hypothetical protein
MHLRAFLLGALFLALLFGVVGCDSGGTEVESLGDSTTVAFDESETVVGEGDGTYEVDLTIEDAGFKAVPATISYSASESSAARGEDIDVPGDTTIRFSEEATSGSARPFPISVIDDDIFAEGTETAVFTVSVPDSVGGAGETNSFTLTIEENDETLTTQEARGREAGSRAVVEGTVTRVESDGVYLQDDAGALFVFDSDVPGETTQGDEVRVDGSTTYFSGLFQLEDVGTDGVTVLSGGNDLPEPDTLALEDIADGGGEAYESELVRVRDFSIDADGDDTFQAGGSDGNYTIQDETGSLTLRIPGGSELAGEPIPDRANFEGVLTQFNDGFGGADEPDTGYQLLGLQQDDLEAIESVTINEARSQDLGTTFSLSGTVTRAFGAFARIEDDSGPTGASAVVLRQTDGDNADAFQQDIEEGTIQPGTEVRLTGALSQFSGLEQINGNDLISYEIVGQGGALSPQSVALTDIESPDGEEYESELLQISNLSFPDASGDFESGTAYMVEDGSGNTFTLRVQGGDESNVAGEPIPTGTFTFEGVLGQFNNFSGRDEDSGYQLLPIQPGDIQ